jgi:HEAT repeat protein
MSSGLLLIGGGFIAILGIILLAVAGHDPRQQKGKALPVLIATVGVGITAYGFAQGLKEQGINGDGQASASSLETTPLRTRADSTTLDGQFYQWVANFKDYDPSNNEAAREGIYAMGPRVIPELIQIIIKDDSPGAREEATRLLTRFGEQAVEPLLEAIGVSSRYTARHIPEALGNMGSTAVPQLLSLLSSEDARTRRLASEALALTKDEGACTAMLARLKLADSEEERIALLRSLGRMGHAQTTEPLLAILKTEKDEEVVAECLRALGLLPSDKVVDPLLEYLKSDNAEYRAAAASALGFTKSRKAVAPLENALNDKSQKVRANAAFALGKIGHKDSLWKIQKALENEKDTFVTRMMRLAIEELMAVPGKQ